MKTFITCRRDWNISKGRGVTLIGIVDSYTKKTEAEKQLKSYGRKGGSRKIEVKYDSSYDKKDDNNIFNEILNAFKRN